MNPFEGVTLLVKEGVRREKKVGGGGRAVIALFCEGLRGGWGLWLGGLGIGRRVRDLGFLVQGSGCRVQGLWV